MAKGRFVNAKQLRKYELADDLAGFLYLMLNVGAVETIDPNTKEGLATREALGERLMPWANMFHGKPEDYVWPEDEDVQD